MAEILPGLWRVEAVHPEWTAEDNDGWDPEVGWLALDTGRGLLLIDPLVEDWAWLDRRVTAAGRCAGVVRTIHWHERTVAAAADRYTADVWARPAPPDLHSGPLDQPLADGGVLPGGVIAFGSPTATRPRCGSRPNEPWCSATRCSATATEPCAVARTRGLISATASLSGSAPTFKR